MGNYSQPFPTVIDAIIKALENALPERVTGAHFGTFSGVRFRGKRLDTGTLFDCHDMRSDVHAEIELDIGTGVDDDGPSITYARCARATTAPARASRV